MNRNFNTRRNVRHGRNVEPDPVIDTPYFYIMNMWGCLTNRGWLANSWRRVRLNFVRFLEYAVIVLFLIIACSFLILTEGDILYIMFILLILVILLVIPFHWLKKWEIRLGRNHQ